MAEAVASVDGVECDLESVQTNIVFFRLTNGGAAEFVAGMKAKGVLCSSIGPDQVRLVTHYDVSREDCERAASLFVEAL
jgi:threonine aldolase